MSRLAGIAFAFALAACHPFDDSQVPVITVGRGLQPEIAWTPSPAYELRVYAGDKDGDLSEVIEVQGVVPPVWYARGPGGYENRLASPVTVGVPLTAGAAYTVTVFRMDEKGSGDGFTSRRHRYVGTLTFVASD